MKKHILTNLTKEELVLILTEGGHPKWRADQIWSWIYCKGVSDFDQMTNLSLQVKNFLKDNFEINSTKILKREFSSDGTEKIALELQDKEIIEMVFIPEAERGTLCISSQVGCAVKCAFCFTGTQGFTRNLETCEIIDQVLLMRNLLDDKGSTNNKRTLTNIVVMGMGEPFHNYQNVSKALKIIMDQDGIAFSKRRITLSTSGVVPLIKRCGEELGVNLAISLHASNNKTRNKIMPINKEYPIEQLIEACKLYPGTNQSRKITFEYVMLDGINDSENDAKELAKLISGIPAKINLIPWNPWPGANFKTSSISKQESFARILIKAGYAAMIRSPRGQDISAACGQLKTKFTNN